MKANRNDYLKYLSTAFNFKYFLTLTFCRNSPNSDKDIERFLRIIHQELFGRRFIQTRKLLGIAVIRERPEYSMDRNHYHILIEERDGLNLIDLMKAICGAANKCDSIKSIPKNDYKRILIDETMASGGEDRSTIKLGEFDIQDKHSVINYVLKEGDKNDYNNVHISTEKTYKSYFPIITR